MKLAQTVSEKNICEKQGRSENCSRLSKHKSLIFPHIHPDDLSHHQNAIARSQGDFTAVKENYS